MANIISSLLKSEIVTPEGNLYSKDVYMITMPGHEGELGVLVGHVPMIVTLKPGLVITYNEDMQILDRIFIRNGFAEITNNTAILLVDKASPIESFNISDSEKQLVDLKYKFTNCEDAEEKEDLNKEIAIIEELLLVLKANNLK